MRLKNNKTDLELQHHRYSHCQPINQSTEPDAQLGEKRHEQLRVHPDRYPDGRTQRQHEKSRRRQCHWHHGGMVRPVCFRHRFGPGVQQDFLPGVRCLDRHPPGVRHLCFGLWCTHRRGCLVRPLWRQAWAQIDAADFAIDHGRGNLCHRSVTGLRQHWHLGTDPAVDPADHSRPGPGR
ncbi:hypothetical protein D3C86_1284870 [compost metagenome]